MSSTELTTLKICWKVQVTIYCNRANIWLTTLASNESSHDNHVVVGWVQKQEHSDMIFIKLDKVICCLFKTNFKLNCEKLFTCTLLCMYNCTLELYNPQKQPTMVGTLYCACILWNYYEATCLNRSLEGAMCILYKTEILLSCTLCSQSRLTTLFVFEKSIR